MTLSEFRHKWEERRDDLSRLGAHVEGAKLIDALLTDLQSIVASRDDDLLNLTQAAEECGYSADHIGRLVGQRALKNYGRQHAPRVRRGDLPRKPGQSCDRTPNDASPSAQRPLYSHAQIARSLATKGAAK